jgi:CheY-like chemotaxis protein
MAGKNILVVDDEEDVREFLKNLLEDQGYVVTTADNGLKGMDAIKAKRPDLILLDLLMPQETGTGLYRKLHGKEGLESIPVIVISGLAGRNVAVSKSVPVFDKPIDETGLLAKVAEILAQARPVD